MSRQVLRAAVVAVAIVSVRSPALAQKTPEESLRNIYRAYQISRLCAAEGYGVTPSMIEIGRGIVVSASERHSGSVGEQRQRHLWRETATETEEMHRNPVLASSSKEQCERLASALKAERYAGEEDLDPLPEAIGELPTAAD